MKPIIFVSAFCLFFLMLGNLFALAQKTNLSPAEIGALKAKAEKGDAKSQFDLGDM